MEDGELTRAIAPDFEYWRLRKMLRVHTEAEADQPLHLAVIG